jgi:hypothetical protein
MWGGHLQLLTRSARKIQVCYIELSLFNFRGGKSMRILSTIAALAALLGICTISQAQTTWTKEYEDDGQPFEYSFSGSFIDGEPMPTYQSSGGTAVVEVGVYATWTVLNTDTRQRLAAPQMTVVTSLSYTDNTGKTHTSLSNTASGGTTFNLNAGQSRQVGQQGNCSGPVSPNSYTAYGLCTIADGKTTDTRADVGSTPTTVN